MGLQFEPVIKIGDILTLIGFLAAWLGFFWTMRGDLRVLAHDVRVQGEEIKKLGEIITRQAVQGQRLDDMDRRIEDLRHGRGFVQRDIDGLWGTAGKVRTS